MFTIAYSTQLTQNYSRDQSFKLPEAKVPLIFFGVVGFSRDRDGR